MTGFAFSAYKDISVNMNWNTNVMSTSITGTRTPVTQVMSAKNKVLTWAFATGECGSENWAGVAPAALVAANVNAFVSAGKQYIVATGGAAGAFRCSSDSGFTQFLQRYDSAGFLGVDFDIEGGQSQTDINNLVARVKAARSGAFNKLRYSFTIATLGGSSGNQLNQLGAWTVNSIKNSGVSHYSC
jgi:chitinase